MAQQYSTVRPLEDNLGFFDHLFWSTAPREDDVELPEPDGDESA